MTVLFNMGVPMIMPTLFFMTVTLVPIILIEAYYSSKKLRIPLRRVVGSTGLANVISTFAGLPLTWTLLFAIQLATGVLSPLGVEGFGRQIIAVTLQAPWIAPSIGAEIWMFHAAALFLLIPFFFATWLIEYVAVRNKFANEIVEAADSIELAAAERKVNVAVRNANLITYGLIALLLVISLLLSYR